MKPYRAGFVQWHTDSWQQTPLKNCQSGPPTVALDATDQLCTMVANSFSGVSDAVPSSKNPDILEILCFDDIFRCIYWLRNCKLHVWLKTSPNNTLANITEFDKLSVAVMLYGPPAGVAGRFTSQLMLFVTEAVSICPKKSTVTWQFEMEESQNPHTLACVFVTPFYFQVHLRIWTEHPQGQWKWSKQPDCEPTFFLTTLIIYLWIIKLPFPNPIFAAREKGVFA